MIRTIFTPFLALTLSFSATAQSDKEVTPKTDTTFRVFGLPVLFYTPDTRLGFGAGGIATFYSKNAPQRNNITFGVTYTQNKQFLAWLPYQIYFGNGKWQTYGEFGWFNYIFPFFGVGNTIPNEYSEKYTAKYPKFKTTVLKNIKGAQFLGLRYGFDQYKITKTDSSGLIQQGIYTGFQGGTSSGLGLVYLIDSRDNRFYPSKGWLVETSLYAEDQWTGSDFRFQRVQADGSRFHALGNKDVIAVQGSVILSWGNPPFFNLATLGGTKRLRGYFDGKYRDNNAALLQAEWRRVWFWRIGTVVFGGIGNVWGRGDESTILRYNYGLGLRFQFDKKQKLNIRADYGFGKGNQGFYLTVGEAI